MKIMETNNQNLGNDNQPDETPERQESQQEGSGYTPQREQEQQDSGNEGGFSEQVDVTPPNEHEFPSEGPGHTSFENRPHGRTTGRMVGHEPGTETGNI
jgi:hypothetical protein